jgi:hypothetical protein
VSVFFIDDVLTIFPIMITCRRLSTE